MGMGCKLLAAIYGFLGFIGSITISYNLGATGRWDRNWGLTIALFLGCGLSVAIICMILYTLGDIHETLSGLNHGLYHDYTNKRLSEVADEVDKEHTISNHGWKCPDCGRVNNSYETTCKCGRAKD